ncbi:MAG: META domain-containing protein [Candidatus Pacebacteria bacterium]|nr:META domain-containing protein [Candidatus Paceibacterota bacterium]
MKKILIFLSAIVLLVIVAGIYKFNFTDDDIIIPTVEDKTEINRSVEKEKLPPLVVKDFEGEANPDIMKLDMTKWNWIKTVYSDDKIVTPLKDKKFTLTFKHDNTFSATTDCNGVGGAYKTKDKNITFDKMMSTLMYCDGSQEAEFTKMLTETQSYMFTSKGELILMLKYDSGSVYFR